MTKLQRLDKINNLLCEIVLLLEPLIQAQKFRVEGEQNRYEAHKAIGQCTALKSCMKKVVPFHTMCSYHLNRAAQASARRDRKKRWAS